MEKTQLTQNEIMDIKKDIQKNLTFFLDGIGRTIMGVRDDSKSTETILAIKDPAVVDLNDKPGENNERRLSINFSPVFFYGFLEQKGAPHVTVNYKRDGLSLVMFNDVMLDFKIYEHYYQMFYGRFIETKGVTQEDAPLKLFDN